ncbi:MAG: radical SAM protein [Thermodesulfobacteriota bacterium]
MDYEGVVIRPPSEADSIILQATVGCSHNRCRFCGAYKGVRFRIRSPEELDRDLAWAARFCQRQQRLFLADGDVLSLATGRILSLCDRIRKQLPGVRRLAAYGNAKGLRGKSLAELAALKKAGLARVYLGLESGHDPTLARMDKGVTAATMIEVGQRLRAAGLFLSVTVLLGLAGRQDSQAHAEASGRVLSAMAPSQIAALTLMPLAGTPLAADIAAGRFHPLPVPGLLTELRTLVAAIDLPRVQFQANHASNWLALDGRLPRDRHRFLDAIDQALAGRRELRPEYLRSL